MQRPEVTAGEISRWRTIREGSRRSRPQARARSEAVTGGEALREGEKNTTHTRDGRLPLPPRGMYRPNFRPSRTGFRSPPPGPGPGVGPFPGTGQSGGGSSMYSWGSSATSPYGGWQPPRGVYDKSPQQQQQGPGSGSFQHRYQSPSPGQQQQHGFSGGSSSPRHRGRYSSPPYLQQQQHTLSPGPQTHSPSPHHRKYQASPRTSTPFSGGGGGRSPAPVEHYYKASMLQDPWADLEPVLVSDIHQQYSSLQTPSTGKGRRYFS
ncbi:M-phase-specific PLK1-interacting protein [Hemiscyllium ocellatum]|uniref:M-phase-specific PLK1-interacting protein n=1 Tax=Hemiscyllium ocellatum TaxID=170820 RepID=UPI0029672759|nr:M-phase-specific PLK1-interacting protein [Hemiscyllium ocellatum]